MQVEVLDVDELRARAVGRVGDRAGQRLLAGLGADRDHLAGLDVGREADDEVGEPLERRGGRGTGAFGVQDAHHASGIPEGE